MANKSRINSADLKGLTSAIKDATIGITDLVESVNQRIVHPPYVPSTPIQHLITRIAGFVFNCIRFMTSFISSGIESSFDATDPQFSTGLDFEKKETILAITNGVVGDYLADSKNPLAISMKLRFEGEKINLDKRSIASAYPKINGNILIVVHGLCMNDLLWNQKNHDHGKLLAKELGLTPIYLHYNTGLHISINGQRFNDMIEELISKWPVAVESITIVAHSMGGLISRSALHYGKQNNSNWVSYVKKIVFLGTPHHGAPLEQIGNYIDHTFEGIHYMKPFARIGKVRSSGITDLRFGNLLEEDWAGLDRFERNPNGSLHVPLPKNVSAFAFAACMGNKNSNIKAEIIGDGLVPIKSALGQHINPDKTLHFQKVNTWIAFNTNHMELLSSKQVYNKVKAWLLE